MCCFKIFKAFLKKSNMIKRKGGREGGREGMQEKRRKRKGRTKESRRMGIKKETKAKK
jgi:hypothetical protein